MKATTAILDVLFAHRRLAAKPDDPCHDRPCPSCYAAWEDRVAPFVSAGEPLHLVLPAFPAKSPNRQKVLGALPDMAEHLALSFLAGLLGDVAAVHAPGARLTIGTDGRAFADLVSVSDDDVDLYALELRAMIDEIAVPARVSIDLFSLDEVYCWGLDGQGRRDRLVADYGPELEALRARVKATPHELAKRNGIERFLFEDLVAIAPELSRNQARKRCHRLADRVMQRSAAWSALLAERFGRAIRLSVHPQPAHAADKLGLFLLASNDAFLTPWHGCAARAGARFFFCKRHQAERLGARLVERDGRPSHLEIVGAPATALAGLDALGRAG